MELRRALGIGAGWGAAYRIAKTSYGGRWGLAHCQGRLRRGGVGGREWDCGALNWGIAKSGCAGAGLAGANGVAARVGDWRGLGYGSGGRLGV